MFGRLSQLAQGKIVINTASVTQAQAVVQAAARSMTNAFQGVNRAVTNLNKDVSQMNNLGTTALGTAFVVGGTAAAARIARINALMLVFSRSQELANQRMTQLRQIADATGQSFLSVAESALAILPAVGRTNVDLAQTVSLVQRLALLDPAQGFEGAAFAIRELLGGQGRSLAARFELPLGQLTRLLNDAGGDPQRILDGLDALVSGMGLTQEAFEQVGQSGAFAFERMAGTLREALGTAFTPFLTQFAIPAANAISNVVAQLTATNPAMLQLLTTIPLMVAGVGLLGNGLRIVNEQLRALQATAAGRIALRVSIAVAALELGAAIAQAVINALRSLNIGNIDDATAADPVGNATTRIGQLLISASALIVDAFLEIHRAIQPAGIDLTIALASLGTIIQEGGNRLAAAFFSVLAAIQRLPLIGNADTASQLDTLAAFFSNRANEFSATRTNLTSPEFREDALAAALDLNDQFVDSASRNLVDIAASLGLLDDSTADTAESVDAAVDDIEQASQEMTDAFNDLSEEMREVADEALRRRIEDERDAFDDELSRGRTLRDFAQQQAQNDADFLRERATNAADFAAQTQDIEADSYARRAEALADYQTQSARAAEDFGRDLARIERDTRLNVLEAASKLDASGVFNAFRRGRTQAADVTERFGVDSRRRQEDFAKQLADLQASFETQRATRLSAFAEQEADQLAAYQLQRDRQMEAFDQRLRDEDQDRNIRRARLIEDRQREDAIRMADRQRRLNELVQQNTMETNLFKQGLIAASSFFAQARLAFNNFAVGIAQQMSALTTTAANANSPFNSNNTTGVFPYGNFTNIPTYAKGGRALGWSIVGERGPELVNFTHPARVYNTNESRSMMGGSVTIENFAPVFGDIGGFSRQQVVDMVGESLEAFFATVNQGGR